MTAAGSKAEEKVRNGGPVMAKERKKAFAKEREVNCLPPQKSIALAYFLWLFGGIFGLHHLYLHRDRHAFLWWCTLGGCFGIGWLFEIFYIPGYVRDANEDPRFVESFVKRLQQHKVPPYSGKRFLFQIIVGDYFGELFIAAIPSTPYMGIDFNFLHWLTPLFIAIGVWCVGNIGREKGVLWHCLLAAYLSYPIRYFIYDTSYTNLAVTVVAALVFDHISKEWCRTPPKRRNFCKRAFTLSTAITIYCTVWVCFFYFNGTVTDSDGNKIPVHEAIRNFLASAWWTDMKQALRDTYNYAQYHGWYETWKEIVESMDVDGERNAYKVLGLSATASQAEITSTYRKLSREHHPDKVKDEEQRKVAQQRFIEIQQAYSVLSKIRSGRIRKNKKSTEDEDKEEVIVTL